MTVRVRRVELDGYRNWKAVKQSDIYLCEFSIPELVKYITETQDQRNDPPRKSEFKATCKGQVINHMHEEGGELFLLIG